MELQPLKITKHCHLKYQLEYKKTYRYYNNFIYLSRLNEVDFNYIQIKKPINISLNIFHFIEFKQTIAI